MTDETRTEGQKPETGPAVVEKGPETATEGSESESAVVEPAPEGAEEKSEQTEEESKKLHQAVEMRDIGPCKKHIKVTVDRADIDKLLDKKYSEMVAETPVPGFRPGKAPRKVIERRFHKDVTEQVRGQVLLQSLEQLADENDIAPLTPPNLDP